MFMINVKALSWRYWFVTACQLAAGIEGIRMELHTRMRQPSIRILANE
jgi:hypothetical protein